MTVELNHLAETIAQGVHLFFESYGPVDRVEWVDVALSRIFLDGVGGLGPVQVIAQQCPFEHVWFATSK